MALTKDRCICLRKVPYSETSQILLLLSRQHGLQRVIAKGSHRRTKAGASKFDGGVDLLDLGEAVFTPRGERDLGLLTEWSLADGHLPLRSNLRGLYLAQYAAELVGLLFEEGDPHPEVFDRLAATVAGLAQAGAEEIFLAFELDLLRQSGYLPELNVCANCGTILDPRGPAYFSANRGGMICRNCETTLPDRLPLDPRLLGLLQNMLRLQAQPNGTLPRLPRLSRHQTDPINRLLAAHMQHTLGRKLLLTAYVL
jgi:DNA repair protein RecO (recombination protein O)